jgi:hypothetical protein
VVDENIFNRWWVDSSRVEAPAVRYLQHVKVRAPQDHLTDVEVAHKDLYPLQQRELNAPPAVIDRGGEQPA